MSWAIVCIDAKVEREIDEYLSGLSQAQKERRLDILRRLQDMPPLRRWTYLMAVTGKSRSLGVKAFCLECSGWDRKIAASCDSVACPLWPYRPYRPAKIKRAAISETATRT